MHNSPPLITRLALSVGFSSLVALLVLMAYWSGPLSFDGGLNFSVAQHFLHTGAYARTYAGTFYFPIETDSVFIFVSALSLKILGNGIFASQLPNLFFAILLLLLAYRFARQSLPSLLALAASGFITTTPGFMLFIFSGYGEGAMLSLLMAAWLTEISAYTNAAPSRHFLGGLLFGLAISTKIVAAIALPAFAVFPLLFSTHSLRDGGRRAALTMAGAATSYGAWEVYRAIAMGFDRWKLWWHYRLGQVLERAGTGGGSSYLQDTPTLSAKLAKHLGRLSEFYGIPPAMAVIGVILVLGGGAAVLWMLIKRRLKDGEAGASLFHPSLAFCLALGCGYLVWWLALTPTEQAWLRRLLPGLILLHLAVFLAGGLGIRKLFSTPFPRTPLLENVAAILVLAGVWSYWLRPYNTLDRQQHEARTGYAEILDCISALPKGSQLYGAGWYGAPQFSFYANRPFEDLASTPFEKIRLGQAYLILDHNALAILGWPERSEWVIFRQFTYETLVNRPQGAVLRIVGVAPLAVPTPGTEAVSAWDNRVVRTELNAGRLRGLRPSQSTMPAESLVTGWIYAPDPARLKFRGSTLPVRLYSNPYSLRHFDDIKFRIHLDGYTDVNVFAKIGRGFSFDQKLVRSGKAPVGPWRKIEIWASATRLLTTVGGPQNPNQWAYSLDRFEVVSGPEGMPLKPEVVTKPASKTP